MIGKLLKRKAFAPVLRYVLSKPDTRYVAATVVARSLPALVQEFEYSRHLNPNLRHPACHISLSVPPEETLDRRRWSEIVWEYMKEMGYEKCQWIAFRHSDREHDHIHVIASRIQITDGKAVNNSYDYFRSQAILRELEQKYDLTPVPSSWEVGTESAKTTTKAAFCPNGALRQGKIAFDLLAKKVGATVLLFKSCRLPTRNLSNPNECDRTQRQTNDDTADIAL